MAPLPPELWHQIAGEVYATDDMAAIMAMCSASQLLQDAMYPWPYQSVRLDVNQPHQITSFVSGITSDKIRYVRTLIIGPNSRVTGTIPSRMLEGLVRRLNNLHIFRWQSTVPIGEPLLKVLNNCQNISELRMHYHLGRACEKKLPPSALSTNLRLSVLSLVVEWDHSTIGNPNFQLCQAAILNARNLVALRISIQYSRTRPGNILSAFVFSTQKLLPPLKVLMLYGYAVGLGKPEELEHRIRIPALRELFLTPGPGSNLRNFLATLMRSEQLHLNVIEINWRGPGDLYSVAHGWPAFFEAFLKHFKGLTQLALWGAIVLPLQSLADGISCHGETLEVLTLYHASIVRGLPFQPFQGRRATASNIKYLCDTCPRLRTLTLMLHFSDDLALQRSFQHFQKLQTLTVYSPLCGEDKDFLEPIVDLRYVYALAVQIRSPRLRKVSLNVGLEAVLTRHNPNANIKWESEHRMVWHIEYPKADDGYAGIRVWESLRQEEQGRVEEVEG